MQNPITLRPNPPTAVSWPRWTRLRLTGKDRVKFLHNFCTSDVKGLAPNRGQESIIPTIKGRVLGHGFLFAEEESLLFLGVPGQAERLVSHWSKYLLREEVSIVNETENTEAWLVTGPEAMTFIADVVRQTEGNEQAALETDLASGMCSIPFGPEGDCRVRRLEIFDDGLAFEISGPAGAAVLQPLRDVALPEQESFTTWQRLRIASGFPEAGVDVTDEHLAQELGRTERCISFKKGCYLGQEPIARLDALGHTNRELTRLELQAPPQDLELHTDRIALVDPADGKSAGYITSRIAGTPTAPRTSLALGYVRTKSLPVGTVLQTAEGADTVVVRGRSLPGGPQNSAS